MTCAAPQPILILCPVVSTTPSDIRNSKGNWGFINIGDSRRGKWEGSSALVIKGRGMRGFISIGCFRGRSSSSNQSQMHSIFITARTHNRVPVERIAKSWAILDGEKIMSSSKYSVYRYLCILIFRRVSSICDIVYIMKYDILLYMI
jgi:hypothetical protein